MEVTTFSKGDGVYSCVLVFLNILCELVVESSVY